MQSIPCSVSAVRCVADARSAAQIDWLTDSEGFAGRSPAWRITAEAIFGEPQRQRIV
jgi:hypothetical protein